MISYARLIPKVWNFVVGWRRRPRVRTTDTCSYLDYQVRVWVQSIPPDLQFDPTWRSLSGPRHTGRVMTLQVLLALQANHLRILLYRQNLLNSSYIEMDVSGASTAVDAAKNTIHMIDYFSQVVPVYFQHPEPFNYFLLSALAALFLAVLHAPARFSQVCRSEFYMAVDLVRRSSTRVETSRRLQKIIRSLKLIQRNLNLEQGKSRSGNRSSKSINATTIPGTPSSHNVGVKDIHPRPPVNPQIPSLAQLPSPDEAPIFPALSPVTGDTAVGIGNTSCDDLTNFFEIAGAYFLEPRETTTPAPAPDIGGQMNTSTLCCDAVRDSLDNGDSNLPRVSTDISNPVDGVDFSQVPGMEFFQAEDESLTQIVAGLL
ncbi:hypothetical protein MPDQ_007610 [Monascus purpureus]|uniref:Transcription factor domain-containing protein n=1 Tax=Monascus purpureus TaxID=5098 RepID=A0A507QTZ8_MONPU|nr:hypothetical protein MPDQ_007610 [Monascus purpureus]